MQPDHFRSLVLVEMAAYRVPHGVAQRFELISLREDGVAERARDEAAFRRFLVAARAFLTEMAARGAAPTLDMTGFLAWKWVWQ